MPVRDGRFIEAIGFYDPLTQPATIKLNEDRAKHWLSVGAQPTDTVKSLIKNNPEVAVEAEAEAQVEAEASAE